MRVNGQRLGGYLIAAGVAVLTFDVPVTVEDVLPFHLAGVIPGFILRRWSTFRRLWRRE